MLSAKNNSVATAKASIEQHIEPYALTCSNWPALLVSGNIIFGPCNKSGASPPVWVFNPVRRIIFDKIGIMRPSEKTAHRI